MPEAETCVISGETLPVNDLVMTPQGPIAAYLWAGLPIEMDGDGVTLLPAHLERYFSERESGSYYSDETPYRCAATGLWIGQAEVVSTDKGVVARFMWADLPVESGHPGPNALPQHLERLIAARTRA